MGLKPIDVKKATEAIALWISPDRAAAVPLPGLAQWSLFPFAWVSAPASPSQLLGLSLPSADPTLTLLRTPVGQPLPWSEQSFFVENRQSR